MGPFEYLSVLLSIILGLSITQLLQGIGRLIQARARVRLYVPPVAWTFLLVFIDVQTWWSMFGLRSHQGWTFVAFSVVVLQTILLYLLAALVLPDFAGEGPVDLRANYFGHARWFFAITIFLGLVSLLKDVVVNGGLPERANVGFHLGFMAVALGALISRRNWYHQAAAWSGLVAFSGYIALLFARLD